MQLSETPAFEYLLRASLKDEKKQLLKQLEQNKGKGKVSIVTPAIYNPVDLYKGYPDGHENRQSYRMDKEQMLRLQVREKQQQLKSLAAEIEELKSMIKVIQIERDQSSDEELSKHYEQSMETESPRVREPSPDPNLGMLTGPKIFVKVQFHPSEFKPYSLDCMIDFRCQVNLAKGSSLPQFYWENTSDEG